MNYQNVLDSLTAFGTVGAVVLGLAAIYYSNKNNRQQLRISKLEELYQTIQSLGRNYGKFMDLFFKVEQLRNNEDKELITLNQYYALRDQHLPLEERMKIVDYLSRIEVLSRCYTDGKLLQDLKAFEDLMFSFADFVFNGGSIHQELKWKNGFPNYEKFYAQVEDLKKEILAEIDIR